MATLAEKETTKTLTTHYIDGEFVESHGREVMDIIKPTNGKLIARVTLGDEEDTKRAIAAAKCAFVTYGRSAKEERLHHLQQLHKAVSARVDDLTAVMIEEYGGVARFARLIVESGISAFAAAKRSSRHANERKLGQNNGHHGAGWRRWAHHSVERERTVHLLKACFGYRSGLHRRSQAERDERAANPNDGRRDSCGRATQGCL